MIDFGEFFEKEFFIKLIGVDDIFQRAKTRKATAYAGGVPVKKKPDRFGCGFQKIFHAGFGNFKIIVHDEHRISLFPQICLCAGANKNGLATILFFQAICNAHQIMRLEDFDPFPACFDDSLPFPFAEQTADCVKRCAGHFCHILP